MDSDFPLSGECPQNLIIQHSHFSALKNLIRANKDIFGGDTCKKINSEYIEYMHDVSTEIHQKDFEKAAQRINAYQAHLKSLKEYYPSAFPNKTNVFYTVLEELPLYGVFPAVKELLCEVAENIPERRFLLGSSKNSAIRLIADHRGVITVEHKDIDFALSVCTKFDEREILIPLVGIETKHYLDKNMFSSILETYRALQTLRPRTYYCFLAEIEARNTYAAKNSYMMGREFFLTNTTRSSQRAGEINKYCPGLLQEFFDCIIGHFITAIQDVALIEN